MNKRLQEVSPSVTLAISSEAKRLKSQGIPVIGFGAGEPDFDTPDFIKDAAIQAIKEGFTRYTPVSGIQELKEAICQKFQKDNNLHYKPSEVAVSCGAKHSIFNLIQVLCNEGDEVVIPAPYWLSYVEMVRIAGAKPVVIPCTEDTDFKITPQMLKENLNERTKIVILNSPSNPTGMIYTSQELSDLGDILKTSETMIISDEIYEHIVYEQKHYSIASIVPELKDRTIVVNGHSKAYAMTGWRIGYAAGAENIIQSLSKYQSHSTSNPCSIAQKAAHSALTADQSFLSENVATFRKRRDLMVSMLNDIPGVSCLKPSGAFYAFANISNLGRGKSCEVAEALLKEAHVALVPGKAFGADDFVRLSYALDLDSISEGLERFARWAKTKK
ncbi:aspartate aminotransferase [PVC group bacterium (ex Bugula neritina AB1)]|nr:aspartate aminotransferase [PVC group bacterium (ex Bugula neritina AB1)]